MYLLCEALLHVPLSLKICMVMTQDKAFMQPPDVKSSSVRCSTTYSFSKFRWDAKSFIWFGFLFSDWLNFLHYHVILLVLFCFLCHKTWMWLFNVLVLYLQSALMALWIQPKHSREKKLNTLREHCQKPSFGQNCAHIHHPQIKAHSPTHSAKQLVDRCSALRCSSSRFCKRKQ